MPKLPETIEYLRQIADTLLPEKDRAAIWREVDRAEDKLDDDKLYLALVGEFSSGKSTFINALLGFRLLKEAVMPTTACATYIMSGGTRLQIDVEFFDGRKFIAVDGNHQSLSDYLALNHKVKCITLSNIIDAVTSHQTVAQTVKALTIRIPDSKIPPKIVIIDTPGFNPGADSVANHAEITRQVVESVADAAIVLTSQEQPMSASLINFLNSNLKRCLHRCTYVVTKVDNTPGGQLPGTLAYVEGKIREQLGVDSPKLFGESAITMLPVKMIPPGMEERWEKLQRNFAEFENMVWSDLQKNRELVLREHVSDIVRNCTAACREALEQRKETQTREKKFLDENSIAQIETVCSNLANKYTAELTAAAATVSISFTDDIVEVCRRAEELVKAQTSFSNTTFQTNVKDPLFKLLTQRAKLTVDKFMRRINARLTDPLKRNIRQMQKEFTAQYKGFPGLAPKSEPPKIEMSGVSDLNIDFKSSSSVVDSDSEFQGNSLMAGILTGATAGTFLGGPIGTIIGGIAGFFGGGWFGDRTEETKKKIIPQMKADIRKQFDEISARAHTELSKIVKRYQNYITTYSRRHVREYGTQVKALIEERERRLKELTDGIATTKQTIANLDDIHDRLSEELAMMKISNNN